MHDPEDPNFEDSIDICPVEDTSKSTGSEWRIRTAKGREKQEDAKMVQALTDSTFNKVCIDSGAAESVCPIAAFPSYPTTKDAKSGKVYRAAGGMELTDVGEIRPKFTANGILGNMAFRATTDIRKPLASAAKVVAKGNRIILDEAGCNSYIENKKTGKKIPLSIENGVYMMEMVIQPFQRPV